MDIVVEGLVKQFQADHDLDALAVDEAFEAFAGFCVLSAFYESDFTPDVFRMGGGNDYGIDVYGILVNGVLLRDAADVRAATEQARQLDVHVIVVQAKTSPRFETKVIADLADNLAHVVGTGELPYPASPDVDNLRACLDAVYANIAKFSGGRPRLHVRYVTTGDQVAEMLRRKATSAERNLMRPGRFDAVEVRCVTRDELRDLYKRATQAVPATFEMPKKLSLPRMPGVEESLLGLLSARELVTRILTDPTGHIRKALFHENVRDFQGYNGVNAQIRDTVRDEHGHRRFAVLNNGVTIVTRNLRVVGDEVHIRDFQVVNGCQTCHVLFDERDRLSDEVQISVRVVHSEDEEVIAGIIAATNRQTAVSEDDLSSREDFHKRLEDWFAAQEPSRRLWYERRSKQYVNRQDVEKTRVINRAQLTRAYTAMFLGAPSEVGHYRELTTQRRDELFQPEHLPDAYYVAAATHYRIEWLLRTRRIGTSIRPARYHLMAALRWQVLGPDRLAANPRRAAEQCRRMIDLVWDPGAAERAVVKLLPTFNRIMAQEESAGIPPGEMVRNRRFTEAVRAAVLPAQRRDGGTSR
ncbi:AIPR family protein [Rhizomonospora bruguierae]|uniref:AIPR family protein n=1 Tax=Rhizomonospora bruguierae TaxID=1581705 RepID=UPI001BD0AA19|nr:AIPR family protein [Micromonospora sp. NBRC 107566]